VDPDDRVDSLGVGRRRKLNLWRRRVEPFCQARHGASEPVLPLGAFDGALPDDGHAPTRIEQAFYVVVVSDFVAPNLFGPEPAVG